VLDAIGAPVDVAVVDVAPWQPYEQVACEFRAGRVFLLGDAAHTMPPFKGGGANTAIQSANNLAWKLTTVLSGAAGDELLDTYQAERHPVGVFAARQSLNSPTLDLLKLGEDRPTLPADEDKPFFYMIAGYKYRSPAVVDGDAGPGGPETVQLVDDEQLRGEPGTRVPHVWLQRDGTEPVSTLDVVGRGFTILTGPPGAAWNEAARAVSDRVRVPITVQVIADSGGGVHDRWAQLTGLPQDGALLIRPDNFVGWRAETMPQKPEVDLGDAMRQILSLA
jgi:hypothetical protein